MDPFDPLAEEPSPEEIALALRGQPPSRDRQFATLAALGGRRAADLGAQFGQNALAGERQQQAQAGQALRIMLGRQKAARSGPPSPLGRLFAERDALPPNDPRRAQYDAAIKIETTRKEPAPYYNFFNTAGGIATGDARTGTITPPAVGGTPAPATAPPVPSGAPTPARPVLPAAVDPDLQARLAAAKARGTAEGEATAKAQGDLPRATAQADELLRLTGDLLAHPGLEQAVGMSSVLPVQKIPGTDARDFMVRLDQIRGKQFLEAFQQLKGSGAITETEGRKATEAIARMDTSTSEPEFKQAVRDFQDVVRAGLERTRARAGDVSAAPQSSDTMPDPAAHVGRVIRDGQTGQRYRSDGRNWVRVE